MLAALLTVTLVSSEPPIAASAVSNPNGHMSAAEVARTTLARYAKDQAAEDTIARILEGHPFPIDINWAGCSANEDLRNSFATDATWPEFKHKQDSNVFYCQRPLSNPRALQEAKPIREIEKGPKRVILTPGAKSNAVMIER